MDHTRSGRSIDRPTCGCVDEMKKSEGHESIEVKKGKLSISPAVALTRGKSI